MLLSLSEAKVFASITTNDPVRDAALQAMIDEAADAVKRWCQNGNLERTQYTQIMALPSYPTLILPYGPVHYAPDADPAIDLQIYVNVGAWGQPDQFTSGYLLQPYQDWVLETGPTDITTSESGLVRLVSGVQGVNRERPLYSLAVKVVPTWGAVKVVYTAGYATVPASIKAAMNLIVRKLYNARKDGVPAVSESLNGYAISRQNSATAEGMITGDPTIRGLLKTFCRPQIGSYF